ncbi:MAG: DTW domain-containing protein [Candidatus Delongbacteria bacterium]|nr:DTW domain-containing protein [Candidatus Delongbacteria bacterium]MBN2833534.1 DTW domain-containing protein [Candidatus Delongbacteria bacterium]
MIYKNFIRENHKNNPNLPLCERCNVLKRHCICSFLDRMYDTKIRISMFLHFKELFKLTNTGKFIPLILNNSYLDVHGLKDNSPDISLLLPDNYENVLLFPYTQTELNQSFLDRFEKPINLIVPDASWRQSARMIRRYDELCSLKRVKVNAYTFEKIRMRKNLVDGNISTIEAVAAALASVDDIHVANRLQELYDVYSNRILNDLYCNS